MRYWKRLNPDGSINTVEDYSHDLGIEGAVEITETEFNDFINSLPEPEPSRDLASEIDELKARLDNFEKRLV